MTVIIYMAREMIELLGVVEVIGHVPVISCMCNNNLFGDD